MNTSRFAAALGMAVFAVLCIAAAGLEVLRMRRRLLGRVDRRRTDLHGRHFYCVDFLTGRTLQLDRTLGKVGIACADGMLYCLNHEGTMSLLAITPTGFEIVSQFSLGKRPANTYLAHPVICGRRLYLRGEQHLYVFDVGSGQPAELARTRQVR